MGLRENKQIPEDELSQVTGGIFSGHGRREKQCPVCEGTRIEAFYVGKGWRQRRFGRCKSCGYEAGWGSFI